MSNTRKSKTQQRKQENEGDDDDEVVVDEEKTRASRRKRSSPPPPSSSGSDTPARKLPKVATTPNKKKPKSVAAFVTPPAARTTGTATTRTKKDAVEEYVPVHIHKNVEYHRKGQAALLPQTLKAFQLIEQHYSIPKDLEQNRIYGPLSGSCYEERAITAYRLGKLQALDQPAKVICTACVELGHQRDECPTLL